VSIFNGLLRLAFNSIASSFIKENFQFLNIPEKLINKILMILDKIKATGYKKTKKI
jgi:hypothetical protein